MLSLVLFLSLMPIGLPEKTRGSQSDQIGFEQAYDPGSLSVTITKDHIGINTHWQNWANNLFQEYQEKIKDFGIVRDQAWWVGLEKRDLVGSQWSDALWAYPFGPASPCSPVMYDSGYDNLVRKFQADDAPELLLLLSIKNDSIATINNITASQYSDFVRHVVERYDGDGIDDMPGLRRPVRYFEIGNEVDYLSTSGANHGFMTPKDYAEKRLIPAYLAAKSANQNAVVMCAGLGMQGDLNGNTDTDPQKISFNTNYLRQVYQVLKQNDGARNNFYMDKVAIHYYWQDQNPEFFELPMSDGSLAPIRQVQDLIREFEGKEKPIWITEFGIPTDKTVRDTHQAGVLVRSLILMLANGVERAILYNLKDDRADVRSGEGFGIYRYQCQGITESVLPKESVSAIRTVTNILSNLSLASRDTQGGVYKLTFSGSDRTVTVFWYTEFNETGPRGNEMRPMTVPVNSPNVELIDMLGNRSRPSIANNAVSLTLSEKPVYLIEPAAGCTVALITPGQTVNGVLSTSDCRSPVQGSSYYADRYSFTASAGQGVAISLVSSAFDTYLYLIRSSGTVLQDDDDGGDGRNSRIPPESGYYTLPSSGTYIIEVTSFGENRTGNYSLSLQIGPANDICTNATVLTSTPFSITADTTGAITSSSDPSPCEGSGSNSVWFRLRSPVTGGISIDTFGSNYDTVLAAHGGSCDDLESLACNDDALGTRRSQICFPVRQSVDYFLSVTSYSSGGGALVLNGTRAQDGGFIMQAIPNPVPKQPPDSDGFTWFFRANVRNSRSVSITVSGFTIDTFDGAGNYQRTQFETDETFQNWFGDVNLSAGEQVTANIKARLGTTSGSATLNISGIDANGTCFTRSERVIFLSSGTSSKGGESQRKGFSPANASQKYLLKR
jgi:hypothetical protein